jgi:hypothetical protein
MRSLDLGSSVCGLCGLLLVAGCSQQDGGEVGKLVVGEASDPWLAEGIVGRVIERGSAEYMAQFGAMSPTTSGGMSLQDMQEYAARLLRPKDTALSDGIPLGGGNATAKALTGYSPGDLFAAKEFPPFDLKRYIGQGWVCNSNCGDPPQLVFRVSCGMVTGDYAARLYYLRLTSYPDWGHLRQQAQCVSPPQPHRLAVP